nr:hypothetical protein [Tanacetum cinerariifolium]
MNHDHSNELVQDLAEARKKKKKSRESPKTPPGSPSHQPPPPPPPAGPSGPSGDPRAFGSSQVPPPPPPPSSTSQESPSKGSAAPSPSKTAASAEYQVWTMTDIRLRPSISLTPADLEMDEDMAPDEQAQLSDDEDIGSAHIPTGCHISDKYGVQMMMRFNEIHKFNDGTLQQIDEALDYRVKEFRINRMNPGLHMRFWTRKDVDRCKAFMFAIQRRLRTRRIFRNLESFVGGRVAVCSSLRSPKLKRTVKSRAKGSSKRISLGHYPIMIASSHIVKSKTDIKSPTHYPCGIARTSE